MSSVFTQKKKKIKKEKKKRTIINERKFFFNFFILHYTPISCQVTFCYTINFVLGNFILIFMNLNLANNKNKYEL